MAKYVRTSKRLDVHSGAEHGFYTIKWCSVIFYLHFKKASLRELDIGFPICGAVNLASKIC
jgi:hypothetical protein